MVQCNGQISSVRIPVAAALVRGPCSVCHLVKGNIEFARVAVVVPFNIPSKEKVVATFIICEVVLQELRVLLLEVL